MDSQRDCLQGIGNISRSESLTRNTTLTVMDQALLVGSLCVYCLIGVIGNILILLVYHRKIDRFTMASFIKLLAVIDLQVCALIIPYTIAFELHHVKNDIVCRLFELLRHFCVLLSNSTLLGIAVERYYAVCRPLHRLNEQQIKQGVVVSIVVCIFMAFPSVFMFSVGLPEDMITQSNNRTHINAEIGQSEMYCHFTREYLGSTGTVVYQGFLVILFLGATLVLSIIYSFVYCAVWKRFRMWTDNRIVPVSSTISVKTFQSTSWRTGENGTSHRQETNTRHSHSTPRHNPNLLSVPSLSEIRTTTTRNAAGISEDNKEHQLWKTRSKKPETLPADWPFPNGSIHRAESNRYHQKTATMLFISTLVFIVTWIPFWLDIFNVTSSVPLRFQFFISYASNPLIYGLVNKQVRRSIGELFVSCRSQLRK